MPKWRSLLYVFWCYWVLLQVIVESSLYQTLQSTKLLLHLMHHSPLKLIHLFLLPRYLNPSWPFYWSNIFNSHDMTWQGGDTEWVTLHLDNPNPSHDDWVGVFSPAKFKYVLISTSSLLNKFGMFILYSFCISVDLHVIWKMMVNNSLHIFVQPQ